MYKQELNFMYFSCHNIAIMLSIFFFFNESLSKRDSCFSLRSENL